MNNKKNLYNLINKENRQFLKDLLSELKKTKTDHDFFRFLATKIIPSICLLFPNETKEWGIKVENKCKPLQLSFYNESIYALGHLKQHLIEKLLTNNKQIQNILYNDSDPYNCMIRLLDKLLQLGYTGIVEKYARISNYTEYHYQYSCFYCNYGRNNQTISKRIEAKIYGAKGEWACPKCKSNLFQTLQIPIHLKKTHSSRCTPSKNKLEKLYYLFDINNPKKDYITWKYLSLAEWCWKNRNEFFRKKKLAKENKKAWDPKSKSYLNSIKRDPDNIWLHDLRCEMIALQKKQVGSDLVVYSETQKKYILKKAKIVDFFQRKRFEKYLAILFKEKILTDGNTTPLTMGLKLDEDKYLLLEIEWTKDLVEIFILSSFHSVSDFSDYCSEQFKYISLLINNPGKEIALAPIKEAGMNSNKTLKRAGIIGALEKIFILKKTWYTAILRFDHIILAHLNLTKSEKEQLLKQIQELRKANNKSSFRLQQ